MASGKRVSFITALLISIMSWFTTAWYLMLGVGVVHLHWLHNMPTIGYPTAIVVALVLCAILDGASLRHRYDEKAGL